MRNAKAKQTKEKDSAKNERWGHQSRGDAGRVGRWASDGRAGDACTAPRLAPVPWARDRVRSRREGETAASGSRVGALETAAGVSERVGPSPLCARDAAGHQHGPDCEGRMAFGGRPPDACSSGCSPAGPQWASLTGASPSDSTGWPPSKTPLQAGPWRRSQQPEVTPRRGPSAQGGRSDPRRGCARLLPRQCTLWKVTRHPRPRAPSPRQPAT